MTLRRILVLYLAFPLSLAVFLGMRGSVWLPELSQQEAILLFSSFHLPIYIFAAFASFSALLVIRRAGWPPFLALVAGGIATVLFGYFFVSINMSVLDTVFPGLKEAQSVDGRQAWGGLTGSLTAPDSLLFLPIWIGLHFVYEWGSRESLYFKRFAYPLSARKNSPETTTPSVFLSRVPIHLRDGILALEADKHYVVIHSRHGQGRVLYRFGDAVMELEAYDIGFRVHRSWWVASDAVAALADEGKSVRLHLSNGLSVPVSMSNSGFVRRKWDGTTTASGMT